MARPARFQHMRTTLLIHYFVIFDIHFLVPSCVLRCVALCCIGKNIVVLLAIVGLKIMVAQCPEATNNWFVHCNSPWQSRNSRQKWKAAEAAAAALSKDSDIFWHILTFLWHSLANFVIHVWQPLLVLLVWFETFTICREACCLAQDRKHNFLTYIYTTPCISTGHCRQKNAP